MKQWTIGTNIKSYVEKFLEQKIEKDSIVKFLSGGSKKILISLRKGKKYFLEISSSPTTISQLIRVLLVTGVIDFVIKPKKTLGVTELLKLEYVVNSDEKTFIEGFIQYISTKPFKENWISSNQKDDEDLIGEEYIMNFKNEGDALFSLCSNIDLNKNHKSKHNWLLDNEWTLSRLIYAWDQIRKYVLKFLVNGSEIDWEVDKELFKELKNIETEKGTLNNVTGYDSEIMTPGNFLSKILKEKSSIKIPLMQRKYEWSKELIEKLYNDVLNIKKGEYHYISQIVYSFKDNKYKILDGQQRLTSIFILLTASVHQYNELQKNFNDHNFTWDSLLSKLYNSETGNIPASDLFTRVYGNEDFTAFSRLLDFTLKTEINLHRTSIWVNYEHILIKIREKLDKLKTIREKHDFLFKLTFNILNSLLFTANLNNQESEFEIFENLNTLSKELSKIDLLKNYLLSFVKEEHLDLKESELQVEFDKHILSKFSNKGKVESNINKFVLYFISLESYLFKEGNKEKFNYFKNLVRKKYNFGEKGSLTFDEFWPKIQDFGKEIDLFFEMTTLEQYTRKDSNLRIYWDLLFTFNRRFVYTPIISYLIKTFGPKGELTEITSKNKKQVNKVRTLLFELEKYEIFFQVVAYRGQSLTNPMKDVLEDLRKKVDKDGDITQKEFAELFKGKNSRLNKMIQTPELEKFIERIKNESISEKTQFSILNRLEFFKEMNEGNKFEIALNPSKTHQGMSIPWEKKPTREHVVPQEIENTSWVEYLEKENEDLQSEHNSHLNMIGNLLIADQKYNSQFSNDSFKKKLKQYDGIKSVKESLTFKGYKDDKNKINLKSLFEYVESFKFDDISERSIEISKILKLIYS